MELHLHGDRALLGFYLMSAALSLIYQHGSSEFVRSECASQLRYLQGNEAVREISPPKLKGEWVSTRCEVRPGPEFLIRRYKFHHDNSFSFHQFFYTDHTCTDPAYTYKIKGTIELLGGFLMLEGATEADYILDKVSLMVYKDKYARILTPLLNNSCQGNHFPKVMDLYHKYTIFDWTRDDLFGDCIEGVAFTMHELQLLRHEFHTEFDQRTSEFVSWEELFLGDIHTGDNQQKIYHRPKTYQIPLRKYQTNCTVCQFIHNADENTPPKLYSGNTDFEVSLGGEYISTRCEVRQVYFIIRHIIFLRNYTWEAYYHYFKDPNCHHPQHSMYVKGTHTMAVHSTKVSGGTEYDFTTKEMWITPQSREQTEYLNDYNTDRSCGLKKSWRLKQPQEVTSTGGCAALGVELPHTEFELMHMELTPQGDVLLFTGQRPTLIGTPNIPELRPTSYQSPLVRCAGLHPLLQFSVTDVSGRKNGASLLSTSLLFVIVLVILNVLFVQH